MANLISTSIYKTMTGITSTNQDTRIAALCESVSQLVKTYCNNTFVAFVSSAKTEIFNIDYGEHFVQLTETPLIAINSVSEREKPTDTYTNLTNNTDYYADSVTDTILRNTILEEKFRAALMKIEKISEKESIKRLEELTPLAMIVLNAKPKPKVASDDEEIEEIDEANMEIPDGAKPGPIDVEYKSKMKQSPSFEAETGHEIKTWGRVGTENGIMGVWGEFVSVDFDICVADGACIDACPVAVYEFAEFPGNPASDKKPLMSKEPDCIFCLACEGVCPPKAIKIFEQK